MRIGIKEAAAQELFPTTEPASTMPKKVFGYRQINEMFRGINDRPKHYSGFRVMYGVSKRLTVMAMIGASNHHMKNIPANFTNYLVNHHGAQYPEFPFLIEGIHVYAKQRLVTFDGVQKHFRIAGYGEASKSFVAHTEAETNLMTENSGYGAGLIFTALRKRFATSFTWGFMNSLPYEEETEFRTIKFNSGNTVMYNVSFGYRIFPRVYNNYKGVNLNLYSEFINKVYDAAQLFYDDVPYDYDFLITDARYTYNGLIGNAYSEMRNSVQLIFDSSTRLDLGFAVPVYSRSYLHDYPLVFINVQKYLFRK